MQPSLFQIINYLPFLLNINSSEQGLSKKKKRSPNAKLESERKDTKKRVRFARILEVRWPHGYYARPRIERSGFVRWPGTSCCVLEQDTLL